MSTDVRPFATGSEADSWRARNCERCALNTYRTDPDGPSCPLEEAISLGFLLGTIPSDLATEYGATVRGAYCDMPRQCSQFVPLSPYSPVEETPNS